MYSSAVKSVRRPLHSRPWLAVRLLGLTRLVGLAGLASCASLPTIVPGLARRPGPPVQLEGARGPLSAAQSKAILDRLASRGQDTSIFDRHLALEEAIVGSPLTTGNRVVLLQDGPATYRAMLSVILAAREQHQPGDLHPGRR
jgi:cardiolipin synthase